MSDCTIIIFGATGDLSRRKLLPALAHFIQSKTFDRVFWIGAAQTENSVKHIVNESKQLNPTVSSELWDKLIACGRYLPLHFDQLEDYTVLAKELEQLEKQYALSGNRIAYLAAASDFFCTITENMAKSGIVQRSAIGQSPWCRVAYEKPFGHDFASAHIINECISRYLFEHQIYRVDHYLTKELVSNIALVRFTNAVFEPLWNHYYIDSVQIILDEAVGIEGRGGFYDQYGALSDVVQNHILQLLALVAMEAPHTLSGDDIRSARAAVLQKIKPVDGIFGQVRGYQLQAGVVPESDTETFVACKFYIENDRWNGVPFFIRTGKGLAKKQTVIHIVFKSIPCLLTRGCPVQQNVLTIRIAPNPVFQLLLNVKEPGTYDTVRPVAMEFCHSCLFGEHVPDAYEVLFEEIARAEQATSVRLDEIEYAWLIIDAARRLKFVQELYTPGSMGPVALLQQFNKTHNIQWQS